ncbi:hypothetical protein V1264_020596 [Littorina saxatilis]|uniref:ATR-interacting protein n=2 Tax=Littorina saxatilis TaxID=31220 RepID=A0AAN9BC39_9CAEN
MAHSSRDPHGGKRGASVRESEEGKQSKRRRLDNLEPDEMVDWDDSFEMTQQDLECLDVVASQAIGEPSTSKEQTGVESREADQTIEFETTLAAAPTEALSRPGFFQAPAPGATVRLKNRSSTSSSSDSTYPQSSASFRKTPSSDLSTAAGSLTSKTSSGHSSGERQSIGEITVVTPGTSTQNGAAGSGVTVTTLREELRKKVEEAQKALTELYAKDGEVKFLKDSLHKQEQELERLRAEREERKDSAEQNQKEKEKELKLEVERLQTQIQFKSQDCSELQQRCRTLENRLTHQSSPSPALPATSTGGVTMSQPQGSPDKSPKVRKVVSRANRTPEKGAFPSHQSFMAPTSPRKTALSTESRETMTTPDLQPGSLLQGLGRGRRRRLELNVPCQGGAQLVSQLLRCRIAGDGETDDNGILGLLQTLPSRLDLELLQYERDSTTARLSPVKKSRRHLSPGVSTAQQTQPTALKPIVDQVNFLLAAQGLQTLISSPQVDQPAPSTFQQAQPPEPSGALLLLPMLNDYISHYIDILTSGTAAVNVQSPNLSSGSVKSSSCESGSSLESVTSSLGMLLQQGAEYANSVETLTLSALHALHALVCVSSEVRSVCLRSRVGASLLQPATDTSSSTIETDQEKDKTNESGVEGDDEQSSASASSRNSSFVVSPAESLDSQSPRLQGLNLLLKVLRLASPSHESSGFKESIVEAALGVLLALAISSSEADVDRLHVVVLRGVLTECLQLEQKPCITLRALDLFSCLARSRAIVPFFCSRTDACTLLSLHLVSTRLLTACRGKQQVEPQMLQIISKVVDSVSSVVSHHRNGVHTLTGNSCRCSGQIIPSLVHAMFYLLRDYQASHSTDILGVLRKGMLLLHDISLRDPNFQQRHGQVHLHYTTLMSGLARIYKDSKDLLPHTEVSALEDLWEDVDLSDSGSQDSDQDEHIDAQ